jgi:hypothetical protein
MIMKVIGMLVISLVTAVFVTGSYALVRLYSGKAGQDREKDREEVATVFRIAIAASFAAAMIAIFTD